jgi:hypothetical protein
VLVDSSGVRSVRWVVGVGAAGSIEGLVACPEGVGYTTRRESRGQPARRRRYRQKRQFAAARRGPPQLAPRAAPTLNGSICRPKPAGVFEPRMPPGASQPGSEPGGGCVALRRVQGVSTRARGAARHRCLRCHGRLKAIAQAASSGPCANRRSHRCARAITSVQTAAYCGSTRYANHPSRPPGQSPSRGTARCR